MRFVANH
jgi:hypothetical protein